MTTPKSPDPSLELAPRPRRRRSPPWARLTRRRFLRGMIGATGAVAGAAVVAKVVPTAPEAEVPKRWTGKTRWIGHC